MGNKVRYMYCHQNVEQNYGRKTGAKSFEREAKVNYLCGKESTYNKSKLRSPTNEEHIKL
jgi:hypothetical protein